MFINKECELHDMLGLHKRGSDNKCSCGIVLRQHEDKALLPDKVGHAINLLGEDLLRRLALGTLTARDYDALKRVHGDDTGWGLSDDEIIAKAESAQAQYLSVAIDLYKTTEFAVSESVLRDQACLTLAEERWKANKSISIQAKAAICLGWNFIAETDKNVTNGNKARIFERDGVIAIQHAKQLQPLTSWRMRCKQLFVLLGKVSGKESTLKQTNPKIAAWATKLLLKV